MNGQLAKYRIDDMIREAHVYRMTKSTRRARRAERGTRSPRGHGLVLGGDLADQAVTSAKQTPCAKGAAMALFMEVHTGSKVGEVQTAHQTALEGAGSQAVRYLRYWGNRAREVFCLVEAPSREAVASFCPAAQRPAAEHIVVELPGFVG